VSLDSTERKFYVSSGRNESTGFSKVTFIPQLFVESTRKALQEVVDCQTAQSMPLSDNFVTRHRER
jgi:hypothetical protein